MIVCRITILVILLAWQSVACAQVQSDEQDIRAILDQQVQCWNKGDLVCFMVGYWPSDSLIFIGSEITYGYDSTLARYQRRYPNQASMGKLRFEIVLLRALSPDAYSVVGKWFLNRQPGDIHGHFTLLFRRIGRQWYIVQDHSG